MMTFLELVILGLFIGGITGITGASGVLIMVPIFSTFFDIPLPIILGTSLFVDVIVSTSVSLSYAHAKNLEIKKIVWILVGTLLGAQVGSFFISSVSTVLIMFILAIAMIFFGAKMWKNGLSKDKHHVFSLPEKITKRLKTPIGMLVCGFTVGLATGIFGAGGGLIIFIILYSFFNFPIKKAIGTSSFVMLLTALSGIAGYAHRGNLNIPLGFIIGISAAVGGAFSAIFANKVKEKILSRAVGMFFIFFALIMLVLKVLMPMFKLV